MDLKSLVEKLSSDMVGISTCPECERDMTRLAAWSEVSRDISDLKAITVAITQVAEVIKAISLKNSELLEGSHE